MRPPAVRVYVFMVDLIGYALVSGRGRSAAPPAPQQRVVQWGGAVILAWALAIVKSNFQNLENFSRRADQRAFGCGGPSPIGHARSVAGGGAGAWVGGGGRKKSWFFFRISLDTPIGADSMV
jgi:hypothetical protein